MRKLKPNEIECRIGQVYTNSDGSMKGISLLLFKDARCDMDILDETYGPLGWKRSHSEDGTKCCVSIYAGDIGEWISREDFGSESNNIGGKKSIATDSFKRACVNFGIGRELYSAPPIKVHAEDLNAVQYKGKWTTFDQFAVDHVEYDENGDISYLLIMNKTKGCEAFSYGEKTIEAEEP